EGYLFPDTYTISPTMNAEDVVATMLDLFDQKVTPEMRSRADAMGLTMHQVVTIASIVERETADAGERDEIAATYLNRLESEVTNFSLGADPTVQYVLGTPEDWWPVIEPDVPNSEAATSPYNTYQNQGLPPGPIANPGLASINAVLEPAEVDYLFFVAKDDGTGMHAFASSFAEHNENVEIYQNSNAG
ncbi:MAG: endolytic transglycosylase MltG, partial [Thermomicrobiales bacterium]